MNCGIDMVEISRIEAALLKTPGFLEKVFSPDEIEYYIKHGKKAQHLAGFFAAKEAFAKYLGTGLSGIELNKVSVCHNESGKPHLTHKGKAQRLSLSITHDKAYAIAMVCGNDILPARPKFKDAALLLPKRRCNAHKGDFGRVLVVAGSRGMTGAGAMSAYSALRTGCGLVTYATADSEAGVAAGFYPEVMTFGLKSENGVITTHALGDILRLSKASDAVVFGPGLGKSRALTDILAELLKSYQGKLLIDADGLNALAKNINMLNDKTCSIILTPHMGEMSRLTGVSVDEIQANREDFAKAFAEKYDVCLCLKGHKTVVAQSGKDIYLNPTGNPGLATAGTGDVLSGVVAALLAQGLSPFDAASLGTFIHGLAGDIAKDKFGEYSMTASDVIGSLSDAIEEVLN